MRTIPDVITHNYDPKRPFLSSLCDLPTIGAERVLQSIRESGKRTIKADYLSRRLDTETWLIGEKQRLLGPTQRARPVYFFLGDFADGKDLSRPSSIVMPLRLIPDEVLTFTYPDSMASYGIATRESHRFDRQPYHGQVYTKDQIEDVVRAHGLPRREGNMDSSRPYDRFIEVQIWDERPVIAFLGSHSSMSQALTCP